MRRAHRLSPALALCAGLACAQDAVVVTGKSAWLDAASAGSRSTLGGAQWQALGMPDLGESLAALPGVQPNRGNPGQSLPTLRGIGTVTSGGLLGTQQPTTGLYFDDVPLTDPFGFQGTPDFSGFELARLQVRRGPQGVLYGSASLGGAIEVSLVQPRIGVDGELGRATLRWLRHGRPGQGVAAAIDRSDGPAGAAADRALRLEAFAERSGAVVDNLGTGRADADRVQRHGLRLAAAWAPLPATELRLHLLRQDTRADDSAAVWPDTTERRTTTPSASARDDRLQLARAEVEAELGDGLTLSAVTGWNGKQARRATDLTRTSGLLGRLIGPTLGLGALPDLPLVTSVTVEPTRSRMLSHELRLASGRGDGLRWLAGAFRQRAHYDTRSRSLAPGGAAAWGPAGALLPGDELGELDIAARSREDALFGEVDLPLAAGWRASAGARAWRAGVDYDAALRFLGSTTRGSPGTQDHGRTPRLSLRHEGDTHRVYGLLSRGYRVGGVNFDPPAFTPYRSDRLLNRELGWQVRPAANLQAELALFQMDWRDAQVSALTTEPVPLIGVANVGQARSRGAEGALQWRAPGGTGAGVRWAYTEAATRVAFTTAAGTPVPAGARLPGTPRWQLVADLAQPLPLPGGWAGEARADLGARSRRVEAIGGAGTVPGHALLGLGITARQGPWRWQLRVDNVGDVTDVAGADVVDRTGLPPLTDRYLTDPRRWTLTLRHER